MFSFENVSKLFFNLKKKIFLCSAKLSYFSDFKSDEQYGTKKLSVVKELQKSIVFILF